MMPAQRQYARMWPHYAGQVSYRDTCQVCGLAYVKDSPDDRREHQRRHRHVLSIYEPKPAPEVFGRGLLLKVTPSSRQRVRNHLEGIARMFQREGGFSFSGYSANGDYTDDEMREFLIVDPNGRPIGGSGALWHEESGRFRNYTGAGWMMSWIWIVPSERRKGHMTAVWEGLKRIMPGIVPEPPFSVAAASFFANRSDVPVWTRELADHYRNNKRIHDED